MENVRASRICDDSPMPDSVIGEAKSESVAPLGDDLLYGAKAIATFLGLPMRKCFYLLEHGRVPCGKIGSQWIASREALSEHLTRIARGQGGARAKLDL
jgi:hypothetical protein